MKGIGINEVQGPISRWFLVEFIDGTAQVFKSWNEAVDAGHFDLSTETECTLKKNPTRFPERREKVSKDLPIRQILCQVDSPRR